MSHVELIFCGPNVSRTLHGTRHCCTITAAAEEPVASEGSNTPSGTRPLTVHLAYFASLYHEVSGELAAPNALFLFNAGLWGYDDWTPTLEHLVVDGMNRPSRPAAAAMVVTSYCMEEAEDDMDTIRNLVPSVHGRAQREGGLGCVARGVESGHEDVETSPDAPAWLWTPEINPFRSLVERESKCTEGGRRLFENHSWQAIRLPQQCRGR